MVPNGHKPLTIIQDKQKETYTVDLVLVVEEKHTIEYPTLMLWLLIRQACGVKSFVFTHQNGPQRPQTSDYCPRQTKGNIYGDLVLVVEEKYKIECPTLMFWVMLLMCKWLLWDEIFCFYTSEWSPMTANL
jgi:hypothetical protein